MGDWDVVEHKPEAGPWDVVDEPKSSSITDMLPGFVTGIGHETKQAFLDSAHSAYADVVTKRRDRDDQYMKQYGTPYHPDLTQRIKDVDQDTIDTGKAALSTLGMLGAPITGASRYLLGHPMASALQGVGEAAHAINPSITPPSHEEAYEQMKPGVDLAMSALRPAGTGVGPRLPGGGIRTTAPPTAPPANALIEAGERQGISVPSAVASESPLYQGTSSALSDLYIVGSPLQKAAQKFREDLGSKVREVSTSLGSGDVQAAGRAAKDVMGDWINADPAVNPQGSKALAEALYAPVDAAVDISWRRPPTNLQNIYHDLADNAKSMGRPLSPAAKFIEEGAFMPGGLEFIHDPSTGQGGLKGLKMALGEKYAGKRFEEGGLPSEWKAVYEAANKDYLDHAAEAAGVKTLSPAGQSIFKQYGLGSLTPADQASFTGAAGQVSRDIKAANAGFQLIARQRDQLRSLIGVKGDASPEEIISGVRRMAKPLTGDAEGLAKVKSAVGQHTWNEMVSAIIHDMGYDTRVPGQPPSTPGTIWSPNRFSTAYGKELSPKARDLLFGRPGSTVRNAMDDIWTLGGGDVRAQRLANVSKTAPVATTLGAMGTLGAAAIDPIAALKVVGSLIGGRMLAKLMARPASAGSLRRWIRSYNAFSPGSATSMAAYTTAAAALARELGDDPEARKKLMSITPETQP